VTGCLLELQLDSEHMAFLFALAFAFFVAEARRIQPTIRDDLSSDGNPRSEQSELTSHFDQNGPDAQTVSNISADLDTTSAEATGAIAPAARASATGQAAFEHHSYSASMIQKHALISQNPNMAAANSLAMMKMVLVCAVAVGMLICCTCCLVARIAAQQHRTIRIQYLHNGRVVYEWDQTPKAAMIYIRPPSDLKKTDLDIRIAAKHLRVGRKGKPSFLSEETFDFVDEEMSSWSFEDGELHILLKKMKKAEWPAVLMHVNRSGIQSEKSGGLAATAFSLQVPQEPES